jgi:hypothetical protein
MARDAGDRAAGVTRPLVSALMFVALVGGLGAPLMTSVATTYRVSAASAQWTPSCSSAGSACTCC